VLKNQNLLPSKHAPPLRYAMRDAATHGGHVLALARRALAATVRQGCRPSAECVRARPDRVNRPSSTEYSRESHALPFRMAAGRVPCSHGSAQGKAAATRAAREPRAVPRPLCGSATSRATDWSCRRARERSRTIRLAAPRTVSLMYGCAPSDSSGCEARCTQAHDFLT
jgi:hypothetical protein